MSKKAKTRAKATVASEPEPYVRTPSFAASTPPPYSRLMRKVMMLDPVGPSAVTTHADDQVLVRMPTWDIKMSVAAARDLAKQLQWAADAVDSGEMFSMPRAEVERIKTEMRSAGLAKENQV